MCEHAWIQRGRNENDERIRTRDFCTECYSIRYGCYAKVDLWGPVGVWTYRIVAPVSLG